MCEISFLLFCLVQFSKTMSGVWRIVYYLPLCYFTVKVVEEAILIVFPVLNHEQEEVCFWQSRYIVESWHTWPRDVTSDHTTWTYNINRKWTNQSATKWYTYNKHTSIRSYSGLLQPGYFGIMFTWIIQGNCVYFGYTYFIFRFYF